MTDNNPIRAAVREAIWRERSCGYPDDTLAAAAMQAHVKALEKAGWILLPPSAAPRAPDARPEAGRGRRDTAWRGNRVMATGAFWTPERVAQLRTAWETTLTAAQIGERLGCTKCAVIGKANRLGLTSRDSFRYLLAYHATSRRLRQRPQS